MTYLTPHFTLEEMLYSKTAKDLGLRNVPEAEHVRNLRILCDCVLEPVREHFASPVIVLSGYRSEVLNNAVGGEIISQHRTGHAADFFIPKEDALVVAEWIRDVLDFDQLILERRKGAPFIHVSYVEGGNNRRMTLTSPEAGVFIEGLRYV